MGIPNRSTPPAGGKTKKTKLGHIRAILRSGRSLNRFEAERFGDHCLNSTISRLRAQGDLIIGQWEKVATRFGKPVRVLRYAYAGRAA